jgi:hypothetical protein
MGAVDGQSAEERHCVQRLPGPQRFAGRPEQSPSFEHCTHADVAALQTGVSPEHCMADVHPVRHLKLFASQTSEPDPQSPLDSHSTHIPVATWHRAWSDGHEALLVHPTHCLLAELQLAPTPQSAVTHPGRHPTQTPMLVLEGFSQM